MILIKPGMDPACAWFLEIAFVQEVGMCVFAPQAIKNHSRGMKPE